MGTSGSITGGCDGCLGGDQDIDGDLEPIRKRCAFSSGIAGNSLLVVDLLLEGLFDGGDLPLFTTTGPVGG